MLGLAWLDTLNLLDVFNYYLIVGFIASTAINFRRYRAILGLLSGFPSRWPKLLELVNKHRSIFFGWPTLLAIGLAFLLMLSNSLAIRLIWTHASVTFEQLWGHWLPLAAVLAAGGLMLLLDGKALYSVDRFDRFGKFARRNRRALTTAAVVATVLGLSVAALIAKLISLDDSSKSNSAMPGGSLNSKPT